VSRPPDPGAPQLAERVGRPTSAILALTDRHLVLVSKSSRVPSRHIPRAEVVSLAVGRRRRRWALPVSVGLRDGSALAFEVSGRRARMRAIALATLLP
jgi:hypothetical protein